MTAYELMIKTNHYLIKGGELSDKQKSNIMGQLLSAKTKTMQAKRFYNGVKLPNNIDNCGRRMYPEYFIPPYNEGKKLKTLFNQTPKTHILSANMYELEILRLLYLLAPLNSDVKQMVTITLERLKSTCFGYGDDGVGECFDTSLVVLRFLATVSPDDTIWIESRITNYNKHVNEKKRPWYSIWYYWLCLSELQFETAKPEIDQYKDEMVNWLKNKNCVMNSEQDKTIHPVLFCILRNILCKYPEYEYIKDREPYVNIKDGRLYFDISLLP